MPLQIIHQDITKVKCDAIVNPTDALFSGSGGTDLAVHTAAGAELDEECSKLGTLHKSEIVVTKGYRLPCDYILHTTGPIWTGGAKNEEALLRGCYINALFKASELGVKSIAFPLISSGTFGFPKDKVLRIALTAISNYLTYLDTDMDVFICVFNPEVYEISHSIELERFLMSKMDRREASFWDMDEFPCACAELEAAPLMKKASAVEKEACAELSCAPSDTLDEWLKQQDDSFAVTLLKLIDKRHMTDVQCYKRANVSKKTFWKINNDPKYKPSKPTVIAFAIALELDLQETEALLKTVGFSLSHSNTFDMIIEFYIDVHKCPMRMLHDKIFVIPFLKLKGCGLADIIRRDPDIDSDSLGYIIVVVACLLGFRYVVIIVRIDLNMDALSLLCFGSFLFEPSAFVNHSIISSQTHHRGGKSSPLERSRCPSCPLCSRTQV